MDVRWLPLCFLVGSFALFIHFWLSTQAIKPGSINVITLCSLIQCQVWNLIKTQREKQDTIIISVFKALFDNFIQHFFFFGFERLIQHFKLIELNFK